MKYLLIMMLAIAGLPGKEAAILLLSGAGTMEELSETELERFESLAANPLRINLASSSRLMSCGLFSPYQTASLLEYIGRTGDILSFSELATVNGFGEEFTGALKYFVSLESHSPPGKRKSGRLRQEILARYSSKKDGSSYAGKYHAEAGEAAELFLSGRDTPSQEHPELNAASLAVYGKRGWRAVLGDFNVRFGQGLLCWSGFSMSGFPSVAAFRKNGSGISPTGSFYPGYRGIALDYGGGGWNAAAACSIDGSAMASLSRWGRSADCSLQAAVMKDGRPAGSFGWRLGHGRILFYGEAAACREKDGKRIAPAAIAGLGWAPAYEVRTELLARYYPAGYRVDMAGAARTASKVSDEVGISAGARLHGLSLTADAVLHPERIEKRKKDGRQLKTVLAFARAWKTGGTDILPSARWTEKCKRSPSGDDWRHEFRADLAVVHGILQGGARFDAVQAADSHPGFLSYCEAGCKSRSDSARIQFSAFLRICSFSTPDWNSRIYVYERDLPGCFSVPAFYGRGRSISFFAGWKMRTHRIVHRIEAAACCIRSDRTSKTEFRIQYRLRI